VYYGERLNSVTHLLGAVAAAAGLAVLVVMAARQGDAWKLVSFSIYGATLFLLYLFSTLYHSTRGRAKPILAKLDHAAIYLLIAGSYTPFTLVTLRGTWGWTLFGMIWGLAMLGIVVDSLHGRNARRILPIIIYIVMGWLVLIAFQPLTAALPYAAVLWLVAGGLFYTLGIVFYALDKKLRHAHGIWHLFVLAGSASHYLAVVLYVAIESA
jgi:hemolysin III